MENSSSNFTVFTHKIITVRIVVGTTCLLSMIGAIAVILSYACIKTLQSQGRLILVNLALMDFGVGLFNMIGTAVNFDQYYVYNQTTSETIPSTPSIDRICIAQAFLAHYCTGSSILWTASLAIYMYVLVFCNYTEKVKWFLPLSCLFCYGLPLVLTVWLLLTQRLGFSVYNEAAWCGLIINNDTLETGLPDYFAITFGYDIWIYLTIILTLIIYVALFLYLHIQYNGARYLLTQKLYWKQALQFLDAKLIFIPFAFIVLRMWTCILNIILIYARVSPTSIDHNISQTLIHLSEIGDSGQGLANGILFVLLTADVRKKIFGCCKPCKVKRRWRNLAVESMNATRPREHEYLLSAEKHLNTPPCLTSYEESDVDEM